MREPMIFVASFIRHSSQRRVMTKMGIKNGALSDAIPNKAKTA